MKNDSSNAQLEKQLFNQLLEAIRSSNTNLINRSSFELENFLKNNKPAFKSSLKILDYLKTKSQDASKARSYPSGNINTSAAFNTSDLVVRDNIEKGEFCIAVFTFNSVERSSRVLESLNRSGFMKYVEVFMDGPHAIPKLELAVNENINEITKYKPKRINTRAGNYGFRRIMMESLLDLSSRYKSFVILEDDCFPSKNAIPEFQKELKNYEKDNDVLTVYGSHFLCEGEFPLCPRFQGWGWATWSEKIIPFIHKMMRLYLLPEKDYIEFIKSTLTPSMRAGIDELTYPRSCTFTTLKFFAWDETLTHLAALENKYHRPTSERCIYNFGMDESSSHFPLSAQETFRKPPFNLITPQEVWEHY